MPAIEVEDVSKRYGSVTALDRVDLTVPEGEVFGFLGPNGAGKSTMINVFLDFVRPDTGRVAVFSHDCRSDGVAARERMGVLPEGYSVYDRLTGRQHVEFAIESKDTDDDPMAILDRVGLTGDADRQAGGYSKGMAQRLILGMALVGDPDLLILDEPTSGLDPNGAREIRSIIRAENDRGATVFFSSHILEQVEAVCDRVGILTDGRLVAVDTIDGLRESVGGGTVLRISVADLDERLRGAAASVDGVDGVQTEDGELVVTCADAAKMDVLFALDRAGADVVDFSTEEASLETLFAAYTDGERQ